MDSRLIPFSELRHRTREALLLGLRAAVASAIAVAIAQSLKLTYPLYAVVAAVIVTDVSSEQTQKSGVQRLLGTALGAGCGPFFVLCLGDSLVAMGVAIAVMIFACYVAGYRDAAKLAGYVAGLVVLDHAADPWAYARDRFVETSLGIVLAIVVSLLIPEKARHEHDAQEYNANAEDSPDKPQSRVGHSLQGNLEKGE